MTTRTDNKLDFDGLLYAEARRGLPSGMRWPLRRIAKNCKVSHTHLYSLRLGLIDNLRDETVKLLAEGLHTTEAQVVASVELSRKQSVI